ncbi:MAG TPA: 5'-3' exonuclease H3TH domain-containing protein, partial [Gemmatimonadales bacterium]|nr:5'-3' exonuclease H3TH domain-containing protein [Gemmatimonadales bacterium]
MTVAPSGGAPPRLFLVDGYALIYRAFFAMITRPLRTAKGENTSAAWGVANFLARMLDTHRPDYVAWIHDAGDSFRTSRYPEYKSTREKLDEELQADFDTAVERVTELLAAWRVPLIAVEGYEADDVIGTLAVQAAARDVQVVIVSGDKDFYQLIGPRVALLNPGRGGPGAVEEIYVDEANAADRLGVPPRQVADYLAMVGDSSDNVPGVKGIGDKGARKLLEEYGDLDAILAHAADVPGKRIREALLEQADQARLSRELVTIQKDVPVAFDPARLARQEPDREALARVLAELEFYGLARRLGIAGGEAGTRGGGEAGTLEPSPLPRFPAETLAVAIIDDPAELQGLAERLRGAPLVALDTETTSLEPHDAALIGLSLAASATEVWYLPFGHRPRGGELAAPAPVRNLPPITDPACAPIAELLRDATVRKAGQNIKYDWQVLRRAGIELAGVAYDSMLASFVLDPGRRSHAIDALSMEHLGRGMRSYTDLTGKGAAQIPFAEVPVADAAAYCGADSATVLALHEIFAPQLREMALAPLLDDLEMPLVEVLVDMEWAGIA